jgi:hypothetical protein
LKNRYLFIEYHTGAIGEDLDDFGYYLDQLLYVVKDNMPKGFIFGRTEMRNFDNSQIPIEEINKYSVEKLSKYYSANLLSSTILRTQLLFHNYGNLRRNNKRQQMYFLRDSIW